LIISRGNPSPRFRRFAENSCVISLGLLTLFAGAAQAAGSDIEKRIQRIENGLLPPVLVRSEPVPSSKLADRMQALHVPGVSIAVIHGGRIEWARGFGVTKIGGPPVTSDTLFQAASISKPVSALAVLHLVQAGKLDLDGDVTTYLRSWKLPANEFTDRAKVTLRELLSHTAGTTVHGFPGYAAGEPIPSLIQILNGETPANTPAIQVDVLPGSTWRYSGGGYVIVQQALIDVTGVPFADLMQDLVLAPLGMKNSTYAQPLPQQLLARAATPYRADGHPVAGGPHVYPELAPAGLWTTPSDIARYALGVQQALAGKRNRVLLAATAREMLLPRLNHWGLGPGLGGSAKHAYFTHSGGNAGFRSQFVAYDDGDGAVVMTNSDSGNDLQDEVIRTVAHEYGWPDFSPPERVLTTLEVNEFDHCSGAYRTDGGRVATFWREGDHVYYRMQGNIVSEIFSTSEREYFLKDWNGRFVFTGDPGGRITGVTLYENEREEKATRLDDEQAHLPLEESLAIVRRFKEQKPYPEGEAATRKLFSGIASGTPDYEGMTAEFAALNRQTLPQIGPFIARLGLLKSITFRGVGPGGADIYDVQWEHESHEVRISMTADGRISDARLSN